MVDCQPDFALGVENTSQVAPCYSKVWPCFNSFQVTSLRKEGRVNLRKFNLLNLG